MNKVILMGRLTRDPEIRYTSTEQPLGIARYTLAVDRKVKNKDVSADFIGCICFGKAAEHVEKYYKRGTKVIIAGRIQTGSYTNKEGKKVYTTEIVVEEQAFAESKRTQEPEAQRSVDEDGFMNIPEGIDDEVPF